MLLAARTLVDRMRALYRELEQMTGVPIGVHRALNAIGAEPGLQASRLAIVLGMQRPAVSQLLRSTEAHGWIERRRDEVDQRVVRIHLTTAGEQMLRRTAGRAVGILQRSVQALGEAELVHLAAGLPALVQQLPPVDPAKRGAAGRRLRR